MVRLMRWMVSFVLTTLSTSFRIPNAAQNASKFGLGKNRELDYDGDQLYDETHLQALHLHSNDSADKELEYMESVPSNESCIPNAIHSFPTDFFKDQRSKGGIVIHILLGVYACYGLATICDTYFVPSLQLVSDSLGLSSDVAGATFMAAGTSSPELFESIIGSFITEGDIGIGTIVGSAVFNILAVTSVCGLFAGKMVPLDWWPITRDCAAYTVSVLALIFIIYDEKIYWYESTALLIMFVFYVLMMRFNRRLSSFFHSLPCCSSTEKQNQKLGEVLKTNCTLVVTKVEPNLIKLTTVNAVNGAVVVEAKQNGDSSPKREEDEAVSAVLLDENKSKANNETETDDDYFSPNKMPDGCLNKMVYFVTYPINLVFFLTIPNCSRHGWERFYPLTFLMSVVYIGSLSYFVAWMVTVIGYTAGVPDTVMGITFLAIGTSVPEGYSSVIVCKKGMGNMAISNSVGSNVFDILFCLGLPWLIKATAFSTTGYVQINSSGLVYSAMCLLASVLLLYLIIALFKFRLNIKVGAICLLIYMAFLLFASLVEMNVFGLVNLPSCIS